MKRRIADALLVLSILFSVVAVGIAAVVPGPTSKCITTPVFGFGHDCNCDGLPAANNFTACEVSFPLMGMMFVPDWQCIPAGPGCTSTQTSCGKKWACDVQQGSCNSATRNCHATSNDCGELFGCQ
jgi:hypothetical protein